MYNKFKSKNFKEKIAPQKKLKISPFLKAEWNSCDVLRTNNLYTYFVYM